MLPNWYHTYKDFIETSLSNYLKEYFWDEEKPWLKELIEATTYACKWWKRIRSILALEFYMIVSWKTIEDIQESDDIIKYCIALEVLHAYSLVHDDLPALDNDTLRRWEPTVWSAYWEATAILVGDLLNSLSFEILASIGSVSLMKAFGQAVSIKWMIWWQCLDLHYEEHPDKLNLDILIETHNKKTWALIEVSIIWGIILWNLSLNPKEKKKKSDLEDYSSFWKKLWLAFQIKDDLLDVEWSPEEVGKSVWGEQKWFVYFLWLDTTKEKLDSLISDCLETTKNLDSEKLEFIVNYIKERKK